MSVTVALSVAGVTVRAALIAGLAILALLLTGWRKTARAEPGSPRGVMERGLVYRSGDVRGIPVDHLDAPAYHRPGIVRRVLAALASSGLGILVGMIVAVVTAFTVAYVVVRMTDLLGR